MESNLKYRDIPADGLETPHGRLYRPQAQTNQILALIATTVDKANVWGRIFIFDLSRSQSHFPHFVFRSLSNPQLSPRAHPRAEDVRLNKTGISIKHIDNSPVPTILLWP